MYIKTLLLKVYFTCFNSKKGFDNFSTKFGNSNHSDIAMPFNRPQMFRDFENLRSIYTFAPEINCTFPN